MLLNHPTRTKAPQQGFTLLEIIIALFIFTILSIIMTSALHTVITSETNTDKNAARFETLQLAITLMSQDFSQAINRAVVTPNGAPEDAFIGNDNSVTFTRAGLANPLGTLQQSTLQRVRYSMEKESLLRTTWGQLDQTTNTPTSSRKLLSHVKELQFQYLDYQGHFQHRWPPGDEENKTELPRAIRIFITLDDLGKMSQLYVIPGQKIDK